jgi:hypothetical protein
VIKIEFQDFKIFEPKFLSLEIKISKYFENFEIIWRFPIIPGKKKMHFDFGVLEMHLKNA